MAVVAPVPAIEERVGSMRCSGIGSLSSNRRENVEEQVACLSEEKIYIAVGKEISRSRSTLIWGLQNSGGKNVCIIHVHKPAQMIPVMGAKFPANTLKEYEVRAYRDWEREKMHKILDGYLLICRRMGVRAEKLYIEMDSVEKGILELISQHGIRKLVMGAAADRPHWRRFTDLKSRKAIFVRREAPASCHVCFTWNGNLIFTREGRADGTETANACSSLHVSSNPKDLSGPSSHAEKPEEDCQERIAYPTLDSVHMSLSAYWSTQSRMVSGTGMSVTEYMSAPRNKLDGEGSSVNWDRLSTRSPSHFSGSISPHSSIGETVNAAAPSRKNMQESDVDVLSSSPASVLDGSMDEAICYRLKQAMEEVHNSTREAYEEASRRQRAERDALDAIRNVKASETLYSEELKRRKEVQLALAREKEELEKMKKQQKEIMEELRIAMDQKALLENQIAETDRIIKEMEQKIILAMDLLESFKKEKDRLQIERDMALRQAEELRKSLPEALASHLPQFYTDFSFSEIEAATRNFDPTLKIGEGGYGSIYKGILRHTQVAIKLLHSDSLQGPSEFQQEAVVLSKMRHPNLITLVGACPEAWALIYEYLPNGSLEDRLSCKGNSPPLSWQTRVRIATELCSALIFLHSSKPHSIVHGDLKPSNILLDANYVSKLSDFGLCHLLSHDGTTSNPKTLCKTDRKGTFSYVDPEFVANGELTPKSDVYSFGVILLRLLTGRPALGIIREVKYALDTGALKSLLDPSAGDWPFVQAQQLAHLALRCCEASCKNRPDFGSEVWRILEPMRASCGGSSSFRLGPKQHCSPPPYFICPIVQDVMCDPHVAADGFTYEAEAIRAWLDSGHDTSPMTNVRLAHISLVPNHALRSAIQEWLQQH